MSDAVQTVIRFGAEPGEPWFLTEDLPALVARMDGERRYVDVNHAYETFFGLPRQQILGRHLSEIAGPEHHRAAEPYIRKALGGERVSFSSSLPHRDGSERRTTVSYTPFYGPNGEISGIISLIQDVTERSLMAEARARLAAIVDSSDDAIVSKNLDGLITTWNSSAARIYGYSETEAVGRHITLIVPPQRLAEENEILTRVRRGEKIGMFETERQAKDGKLLRVLLSVSPIRNAEGEVIGVSNISRDITQQKRDDEALRRSEEYRLAVLQSMPECVKVLDHHGRVVHMNPAGLRMVEADDASEVIGKSIYPLIKEEDREGLRQLIQSLFDGASGGRIELTVIGLKGTERILESNVVPLRDMAGTVIGALAATRDVTGRKRMELRDAFLVRLDDIIRPLADPQQIIETAAQLLSSQLDVDRCAYVELDLVAEVGLASGNYTRAVPGIVGQYPVGLLGDEFMRHMKWGLPHIVENADTDVGEPRASAVYRDWRIAALIAVPLVKAGRLVAALAVHQSRPRYWRSDEVELVQIVANRCWESIERARVQRELRASEQQFRTLADSIPNLAWMADPDGRVFWYNRRWSDFTGSRPDALKDWTCPSVQHPEILPAVLERWRRSIQTGEAFEMLHPLKSSDGKFRSFLTRIEPIRGTNGQVMRWFGTSTDVTAQQQAQAREQAARQTAELLNRVGPLLAAELDPLKLTQKVTDIATEAVRAQVGALFYSPSSDPDSVCVLYTSSGAPPEGFSSFPVPAPHDLLGPVFADGRAVRCDDIESDPGTESERRHCGLPGWPAAFRSYLAVPVKSRTGSGMGALIFAHTDPGVFNADAEAIATGIAAQAAIALDNAALFEQSRSSSEALRRSNEELARANEDLNQFAYSASHDLREPLRMVSIYTQFLSRKLSGTLDAQNGEFLDAILRGASRMEALIRDLLAYTKAAEPQSVVDLTDANVALQRALSNLATAIEESHVTVEAGPLPTLRIPEVHLSQVLQNLIGNAIKYRSEKPPRIEIGAVRRGGDWEFWVADNGIGIEELYKEQIFGIFKRLHTTDEYSGTGIGLAICQRIVQRAGGRIWVESQPGRGATFFFTIPAAE